MTTGKMKILCALFGVIALAGLAHATGTLQRLLPGVDRGRTAKLVCCFGLPDGSEGPKTTLRVHRSPELPNDTIDLDFTLEIEATGVLISAVLEVGNDTDDDGVLRDHEWTTVSTARISETGGVTHAVGPTATASLHADAYRVTYERTDIGIITETWGNNPDVEIPFD